MVSDSERNITKDEKDIPGPLGDLPIGLREANTAQEAVLWSARVGSVPRANLVLLPWALAFLVWESSWDQWLRILVVGLMAAAHLVRPTAQALKVEWRVPTVHGRARVSTDRPRRAR